MRGKPTLSCIMADWNLNYMDSSTVSAHSGKDHTYVSIRVSCGENLQHNLITLN